MSDRITLEIKDTVDDRPFIRVEKSGKLALILFQEELMGLFLRVNEAEKAFGSGVEAFYTLSKRIMFKVNKFDNVLYIGLGELKGVIYCGFNFLNDEWSIFRYFLGQIQEHIEPYHQPTQTPRLALQQTPRLALQQTPRLALQQATHKPLTEERSQAHALPHTPESPIVLDDTSEEPLVIVVEKSPLMTPPPLMTSTPIRHVNGAPQPIRDILCPPMKRKVQKTGYYTKRQEEGSYLTTPTGVPNTPPTNRTLRKRIFEDC